MSTKDIIKKSVLENFTSDLSLTRICIALLITILLSFYIYYVYRLVTKSSFYSKDFNKTLALMPVITAAIVLAMQSNLVISLGMVGALSIVRFRNAVKNPMDLVFLFWSISIGIICGAGLYEIALIASLVVSLLLFILETVPSPKAAQLLIINSTSADCMQDLEPIIKKYTKSFQMKSRNLTHDGMDLIIEFKANDGQDAAMLNELHGISHISNISILAHDGERRF